MYNLLIERGHMTKLFIDANGKEFGAEDIDLALRATGAMDCETLFIHSDVMFGKPAEGFRRKEYLNVLYSIITNLGVKRIIIPTFTYSFCNHEDYDILNSKTFMGAFNESVRKRDDQFRTDDPLLSVSVPQTMKKEFEKISHHSLGEGSSLDIIHHMKNVKFLFFGAEMAECFTYVHYVEKMMGVPYRFDMRFSGNVIYPDGRTIEREQFIYTQCYGAKLPMKYVYFENEMEDKGILKKTRLGDKFISCISEKDAYREIESKISENIDYYLEEPFVESELKHIYTYNTENGRITHC